MLLAPVAASAVALPKTEPRGWSPGAVSPDMASRSGGLIKGGLDAWRGTPETSAGVPLTSVQVDTLAPFYASQLHLDEATVRGDLRAARIHVGGLAAGAGNTATTVGPHVYVSDAAHATRILSWAGRSWLSHELTHTMQWRRVGADQASDAARDRAFLNKYIGGFVHDGGNLGGGALLLALTTAVRRWKDHPHGEDVATDIHDAHPMEREASATASAFVTATS